MTYALFLRGINVGGRVIKMADLKDCLEKTGLKNVKTYLQSGNAIFESDEPAARLKNEIEVSLCATFNFPAKVWVLPLQGLIEIIKANPFKDASADFHQYVIFFEDGLEEEFFSDTKELGGDDISLGRGVVYWKVLKGQTLTNPLGKFMTKAKYKNFNTNRNINTLVKMT